MPVSPRYGVDPAGRPLATPEPASVPKDSAVRVGSPGAAIEQRNLRMTGLGCHPHVRLRQFDPPETRRGTGSGQSLENLPPWVEILSVGSPLDHTAPTCRVARMKRLGIAAAPAGKPGTMEPGPSVSHESVVASSSLSTHRPRGVVMD
jgi:hypothetical protein